MKRIISLVGILALLFFGYQFLVNLLIKDYSENYIISEGKEKYEIVERYKKSKKEEGIYNIYIKNDNILYNYYFQDNYNKQKRVINKIIGYKQDNLSCILPVFIKDKYYDIVCSDGEKQVSYTYLKQIGDSRVDSFVNDLKTKGYDITNSTTVYKPNSFVATTGEITYYENLPDNYAVLLWTYDSSFFLNNEKYTYNNILNKDVYDTKYTEKLGDYYLVLDSSSSTGINIIYLIDAKMGSKKEIELSSLISQSSYFNGTYKGYAYITDPENKKQYKISSTNTKLKEVGNETKGFKYYDGTSFYKKTSSDFLMTNQYFNRNVVNKSIEEKYNTTNIVKDNTNYYFVTGDGTVYMKQKYQSDVTLLFKLNGFKELIVVDDYVFGISDDSIYYYHYKTGLNKVLSNAELKYNYKKIFTVAKE